MVLTAFSSRQPARLVSLSLALNLACGSVGQPLQQQRAELRLSPEKTFDSPGPAERPAGEQQYDVNAALREGDGLVTWSDGRRDAYRFRSVHARRFVLDGGGCFGPTEQVAGALGDPGTLGPPHIVIDGGFLYSTLSMARVLDSQGRPTASLPKGWLIEAGTGVYAVSLSAGELSFSRAEDGGTRLVTSARSVAGLLGAVGHSEGLAALVRRSDGGTWLAHAPLDGGRVEFSVVSPVAFGDEAAIVTDGRGYVIGSHQQVLSIDGGTETRVRIDTVSLDGGLLARLEPFDGGSTRPSLCFNGTNVLVAFVEPLGCCRSRVWSTAMSRMGGVPTLLPNKLLDTNWVFNPKIACARNQQVIFWGQWNYVETSAAAQVMTVLDSTGARASASLPISVSGQPQRLIAATADWVQFQSNPLGAFLSSTGPGDASVPFVETALADGLDGGWAQLANGNGGLRFELRTPAGRLAGSVGLSPTMVSSTSLLRTPQGWVAAWSATDSMMTARIDEALTVSGTHQLPLSEGKLAATANATLVASDGPNQLRWSTTHADGGMFSVNSDNYFVDSAVSSLGNQFVLVWRDDGLRVAWANERGQLTSQTRAIGTADIEATGPAIACGGSSCLLTYLRWSPATDWDVIGEWLSPDGGSSGPIPLRTDARSEPAAIPVFVSEGHWRLAYNRYEPQLATVRAVLVDIFESSAVDGGAVDGGAVDGGAVDGGAVDGGAVDGGAVDGGAVDGGAVDGGAVDGGAVDGGAVDGGAVDGGAVDGGELDGGELDGGSRPRVRHFQVGCTALPADLGVLALVVCLGFRKGRQRQVSVAAVPVHRSVVP